MRIVMRFNGGEGAGPDDAVNYMMPEDMDADTREALEVLGDGADELYESVAVYAGDSECKGYDEMADRMAAKLRRMGVDLHCVEWWFGSEPDGSPKHIDE